VARSFALLCRLFGAAILCAFACVPLAICYSAIETLVADPRKFDLVFVTVFAASAAAACALLLVAYRAATGRGRVKDGGLLPPLAMRVLVALFAVTAVAIVGMGLWSRSPLPILGGLGYLWGSRVAWRSIGRKPLKELMSIEFDDLQVRVLALAPMDPAWNQTFAWLAIERVCFRDAGLDSSDEVFVQVRGRPQPVVVLIEASGGAEFMGELCGRGYFPEHVWRRALGDTSGGMHCWPEVAPGSSTSG